MSKQTSEQNRSTCFWYTVTGLFFLSGAACYLSIALYCLTVGCFQSAQAPDSLIAINTDDEMVVDMVQRYDVKRAIAQYELTICAIERYHSEQGMYPPDLEALVPTYLPAVPGIYIRAGETLVYSPIPKMEAGAPFAFYVYGHHTGFQFMHGWELMYCPAELDLCGEPNNRHYHPHRINERWLWINRSAL